MNGPFRILMIDDDVLVLELMKHVVRRHKHLVVDATTKPTLALEWIRSRQEPFHIVLSDLVMDPVSGLDIMRAARLRSPVTQGVIVTGFGDQESTIEAIKVGVAHYLRKPFRREELDLIFRNVSDHFELRKNLEGRKVEYQRLVAARDETPHQIEALEKSMVKMQARLSAFQVQEKEAKLLERALTRKVEQDDVSQNAEMQQLNTLGNLYQTRQISDQEFQVMRKSLIDKAYKSIII